MKILILLLVFVVAGSAQSGGEYNIEKSVIASGGGTSFGGEYSLESTSGQPTVGMASGTGNLAFYGFWTPDLSPTAAPVQISGRVTTSSGFGIPNARLTLTNAVGEINSARTNQFGFYSINNVVAGGTYIISVSAKQTIFPEPQRVITVNDSLTNIDFRSSGSN